MVNKATHLCNFELQDTSTLAKNRRCTSGYFSFVRVNLVTCRSKKQSIVARSDEEKELKRHGIWAMGLLEDLGFGPKEAMKLHCGNASAIEIAHKPIQHDITKHVAINKHFIKEKLEAGISAFPFVRSEHQLADVLTKAVASVITHVKLEMCDIHATT